MIKACLGSTRLINKPSLNIILRLLSFQAKREQYGTQLECSPIFWTSLDLVVSIYDCPCSHFMVMDFDCHVASLFMLPQGDSLDI